MVGDISTLEFNDYYRKTLAKQSGKDKGPFCRCGHGESAHGSDPYRPHHLTSICRHCSIEGVHKCSGYFSPPSETTSQK